MGRGGPGQGRSWAGARAKAPSTPGSRALSWMEACLKEELPAPVELEDGLRNGVLLAKLGHCFAPSVVPLKKIYDVQQLRYQVGSEGSACLGLLPTLPPPEAPGVGDTPLTVRTWTLRGRRASPWSSCWVAAPGQALHVVRSSKGHWPGGLWDPPSPQ